MLPYRIFFSLFIVCLSFIVPLVKSRTVTTTTTTTTTVTTTTITTSTSSNGENGVDLCECDVKIGIDAWTPNLQGHNWTLDGALLWLSEDINVTTSNGRRPCRVEIISASHQNEDAVAVAVAEKLIDLGALVIIGLEYSSVAIPVAGTANKERTPLIAFGTNVNVTQNYPYAFRVSSVDSTVAIVMSKLGKEEYNATSAAIIYQEDDPYSNGLARELKNYWESLNGSVVSYVPYTHVNVENSSYSILTSSNGIENTTADVLFLPIVQNSIVPVVSTIYNSGWRKPIIGADGWSDAEQLEICGEACVGALFTANFIADESFGTESEPEKFVDKFTRRYNYKPNPTAALAYDALNLIKTGLEQWNWECDLNMNRDGLRNVMESITEFDGVSGFIPSFGKYRNPTGKCIRTGKVSSQYQPIFHDEYCID